MDKARYIDGLPGYRSNAPETAREAAESMAKSAPSIRKRVLAVIVEAGLTGRSGDTVADKLDMTVFQVRARIAELHAAGLVADSGRREVLGSGRRGVIWIGAEYAPKPDDPQGDLLAAA